MAIFRNGFENIRVELIDCVGNDLAKNVCCFGQFAEFYEGLKSVKDYSPENEFCNQIVNEIIENKTFPKYALQGHSVTFCIRGISRVNLAQFTREGSDDSGTFFCSASSGTRPLTQDQIIPMNIFCRDDWMTRLKKINKDLESLYVEMLEEGIPFMDARYIMPHSQTIDICYTASMHSFIKSCNKRLDNGIADEINYLYRMMINCLNNYVNKNVTDKLSRKLWIWLIQKCDIKVPSTNLTYRNDFERFVTDIKFSENAHNDWRKSQWKMELERMYACKPELLLPGEKEMIESWLKDEFDGKELRATYDSNDDFTPEKSVKKMHYYEVKNE